MKAYRGSGGIVHAFLTSALYGGEWSASCYGRFIPRERAPGTHWTGGWVGPRAVLDAVVKRKIPRYITHTQNKLHFSNKYCTGIHLHLMSRSRMRGATPPLPQYAFVAWCSVKAHGQLYLYQSTAQEESRDSSVDIATRLRAGRSGFDSRRRLGISLFSAVPRPALRPTQPPNQWILEVLSLGVKWPKREADHSTPSRVEVKNTWSYTSTLPYAFTVWSLVKHRDNFTFTCTFKHCTGKGPRREQFEIF
jgi:hypothetical protein